MGGVSQAAVSIAKCLSELHTWRAVRQSLIFARSTSRDVTGMLHAGSKAAVEIPNAPQPCAAVSTLFPPHGHNGWWIIFNPDNFNMVPVNCSCGDAWGTEELDGGFPAGCAAIPSRVTIPSKLTQTSLDISSVKSVKNYFHSEIHTQLLVRCSRKHQVTAYPEHGTTHASTAIFCLLHFSVALPTKWYNSAFHRACNIPWRSLFPSLLFIMIFGVVTNISICSWSKWGMFAMSTAMLMEWIPMEAPSKATYLIR